MTSRQVHTVCSRDCPDACQLVATIEEGRVTKLTGHRDHAVTKGFLCYRTTKYLATHDSPNRITQPLMRRGDRLEPCTWEEALDLAARRLTQIRSESGPAAIFNYRSGGSLGILKQLVDHFFTLFGPVTVKSGDICSGAGDAAQTLDFGDEDSHDLFDLLNSRHIILWGKNASVSSPHTVPVLQDARRRGAHLVLIDPVRHRTAELCETFVQVRPGADFALAMAVARRLFERDLVDPEAKNYCDHVDEFRALAFSRPVGAWCAQSDVAEEVVDDLARRLGSEKPCAILVGWGMARRRNGGAIVRALDALCAISGNIGIPGGGVSYYYKRKGAFDMTVLDSTPPPRTIPEPLFGPSLEALDDPRVRAVWITAGNPVVMLPQSETIARALAATEFVVVADAFLTDTARLAHLVLPTRTLLEQDDLLGAYGHHMIGTARPVVDPPEGVRSDLEIIQGLADRVGLGPRMAGSHHEWKQRFMRPDVEEAGVTLSALDEAPRRSPVAAPVLFADRVFPTPSGRVNLIHQAPPDRADVSVEFPLLLMALSVKEAQSSQWAEPLQGPLPVTVHPDVAAGIPHGGLGRLESCIHGLTVTVLHDSNQRRDVAVVPKGGHRNRGQCANSLVQARITDLGEGGALYDEPVRLVALPASTADH